MRKVYSSPDPNLVRYAKSILDDYKIECVILREQLASAVGGIAPVDAWAEIWVLDSGQQSEALVILERSLTLNETGQKPSWQCSKCGELIEAQFTQCWNCDTERVQSETE